MKETAIVVGASGAFGQAIVPALAAKGLAVLAVTRTHASLAAMRERLADVEICVADIASDAAIAQVRSCLNGPVRMIVHGPGVPVAGGVAEAPTSALTEAINIKVGGMLRVVRAADPFLTRHARLVAIGGHYGSEPTAYAATAGVGNAAVANLIRQLSWEYGKRQVTAHLIVPGPADTERVRRVAAHRAAQSGTNLEHVLDQMRSESAIGAFTTPAQIAWAVGLLLAPEADAMAGSALVLDCGRRRAMP